MYLEGFLRGWDALYPRSISELIGPDYTLLSDRLLEASRHRNKIFHGQLTANALTRRELVGLVADLREWCNALGAGAQAEVSGSSGIQVEIR